MIQLCVWFVYGKPSCVEVILKGTKSAVLSNRWLSLGCAIWDFEGSLMSDFRSINDLMFLTHVSVYTFFTAYRRFSCAEQVIVFYMQVMQPMALMFCKAIWGFLQRMHRLVRPCHQCHCSMFCGGSLISQLYRIP